MVLLLSSDTIYGRIVVLPYCHVLPWAVPAWAAQEAKARGGAAWKAGDVDGAIHWFSEVSSRFPRTPTASLSLSSLAFSLGSTFCNRYRYVIVALGTVFRFRRRYRSCRIDGTAV